ncbi:MAG TPA: DUF1934 domain-containing protein [Bacillales bacterium]|nr:DUF1934 domain-containing protein [Bacillales bacterium]
MDAVIPVVIDLTSKVNGNNGDETTQNRVKGTLVEKGPSVYIRYHEKLEEHEDAVRNVLKIGEDDVTIIRNGGVSMHQRFQEGKKTEGSYRTPFGTMRMETATKQFDYEWKSDEGRGEIVLVYELVLQGRDLGRVTLTFSIREADET